MLLKLRGLWEMKNDAMGGTFVSHMRIDRANARVVVVEGFVYNPGKLKRDDPSVECSIVYIEVTFRTGCFRTAG